MSLFEISGEKLNRAELQNFALEKDLQKLIEDNLESSFSCQYIAHEFKTDVQTAGRIDTLALSEDGNPVIIEYKKIESLGVVVQSLFYLNWIINHKGDFEIAVQKKLGKDVSIDWSDVRVICIAPNFDRYSLDMVQTIHPNIELWKYKRFKNNILYLEQINKSSKVKKNKFKSSDDGDVPAFESHVNNKPKIIQDLIRDIQEFILGLDSSIEEVPKKTYIAYKASQNIVCVVVGKSAIKLYLKLEQSDILESENYKDVSKIGHLGTGDAEFKITSQEDFENTKKYIELAYNKIGG